jgi:DNA-binding NarL/FixJ family response regulator
MRETVVSTLEDEYLVVGAVRDGQEMLDEEPKCQPDAVILDISMPIMGGIEASVLLRQRGSRAKIIFLTVHDEPEYLQAALAAGADGYVVKARMASDLRPAVKEAMSGGRFISPSVHQLPGEKNDSPAFAREQHSISD